jgi:predicted ester cyclase
MSEQENIQVTKANFEALNANDAGTFRQLRAADFAAEVPGVPTPLNVEETWTFNQGYLAAFSETHIDLTLLIAQGNYVVAHYTAIGTHTKPLRSPTGSSIPATGKKFAVKGCSTYELKGGKISRQWDFADMLSLFGQLGLMPPM